ncbi:GGDEF domain-containing protein [Delftia tsuruhatensis]|uniref:GGDEF domain-containing protein n=1 Tax=Delftia tsuruhatensis TaxID=180282 RepID=UPI0009BB614B|nr:GGDEF domain-containing protein [Delftia tsuruhatensis]
MKLEGLRILEAELSATLSLEGITVKVFYFFADKWHDLVKEEECKPGIYALLSAAKGADVAHHTPSSPDVWYYLNATECAVCLTFKTSPKLEKQRRYRKVVEKAQDAATNTYKVSHNQLTLLLARSEFRLRLSKSVEENDPAAETSPEGQDGAVQKMVAILALDIDHFKQVNDTRGHLYGDQVLKAFARRLETVANRVKATAPRDTVIELGHPSGEEFLIAISSTATREQFSDWANEFRKSISDTALPSDEEWQWLSTIDSLTKLIPPPLHERLITTSIGLAFLGSKTSSDATGDIVSGLLDRADTALYRAKAAGRNQVIAYDEILASHGRVLEFESANGVAALDIGSNVGVAIGQEFNVYSPLFSGKTKFSVSDGRSKRTLGTYPRVRAARIVVFDAQPEISFAYVATQPETSAAIEAGSHLEAIPAGSIGHLLPSSSKYFVAAGQVAVSNTILEVNSYLADASNTGLEPYAVVLRFSREVEFLRKFGSVALNAALAQLYREARTTFHLAPHVELIDRGAICVVGKNESYIEDILNEFTDRLASDLPELGLLAGAFVESDRLDSIKEGQDALNSKNALDFARFAASDAGRKNDTRVRHFNYLVANNILRSLKESRALDTAEADCEKLLELGLSSGSIFNNAGLIASALGKTKKAMNFYADAISKAPSNLIYKSNFGTAAYRLEEIDAGLKALSDLKDKDLEWVKKHHAYGFVTYARLLAKAKLSKSPLFDAERFDHIAAQALAIEAYQGTANDVIHKAQMA